MFSTLPKANHVHLSTGLIILSLGGSGHGLWGIYKASSKDPSSFSSDVRAVVFGVGWSVDTFEFLPQGGEHLNSVLNLTELLTE